MKGTTATVSPGSIHRGWGLSIPAVTTCTTSGTKAQSRRAPWLYRSFRQVRRAALTLHTLGTADSDEDRLSDPGVLLIGSTHPSVGSRAGAQAAGSRSGP